MFLLLIIPIFPIVSVCFSFNYLANPFVQYIIFFVTPSFVQNIEEPKILLKAVTLVL